MEAKPRNHKTRFGLSGPSRRNFSEGGWFGEVGPHGDPIGRSSHIIVSEKRAEGR